MTGAFLVLLLLMATSQSQPPSKACRASQFTCHKSANCIDANRYCDQRHDCDDSSDEPRSCTPCNRTYFGDVGKTYELELHRPREDKLPFVCKLTFSAGGEELGDLVQLTFESFTLGRFVSFTADGCPDGALHISESERPRGGGEWCGTSWGSAVYLSESRSVALLLRVLRLAKGTTGHSFDFRISYKMLPKVASVVRYGEAIIGGTGRSSSKAIAAGNGTTHHLGELIAHTSCSRTFTECARRPCRLQSPNWPGVYPRNVTCYYAVRQHEAPPGQHALIGVRQPQGQLVSIRSRHFSAAIDDGASASGLHGAGAGGGGSHAAGSAAGTDRQSQARHLKVWSECDEVQDYVTVYDGYTTRDPVLLRFCGGGEPVPEAVSSGPELLVEFTSAPYGTFLQQSPMPPLPLHGFQLDVEVIFVPQQSVTYSRNKTCEFTVVSPPWRGRLEAPRHSLPRGAQCRYTMRAPPGHRVWLSLLKFHTQQQDCGAELSLWDGDLPRRNCGDKICNDQDIKDKVRFPAGADHNNSSLLARFCRDTSAPSCEHVLLRGNSSRPCATSESFLSSGNVISMELSVVESTALKPVEFRAQYEFVDLRLEGLPLAEGNCARRFTSRPQDGKQILQTPPNVFLYGRGGSANLSCVFRLQASEPWQRVRLNVTRLRTGGRPCSPLASLTLLDLPWPDAPPLRRHSVCPGVDDLPFAFLSAASALELRFRVAHMNATEDFTNIGIRVIWEAVNATPCASDRRLSGASGEIRLRSPEEVNCEKQPWLVEPGPGRYLYVKVRGIALKLSEDVNASSPECATRNRVLLHGGGGATPILVCPHPTRPDQRHRVVEIFSEGWLLNVRTRLMANASSGGVASLSRGVVVEFQAREPATYTATWLELSPRRNVPAPLGVVQESCPHSCPELDACINATLWCDGVAHCPSGHDEEPRQCWAALLRPWLAVACAVGLGALLCTCVCMCAACRRRRRRRRASAGLLAPRRSKSVRPAAAADKEVIC